MKQTDIQRKILDWLDKCPVQHEISSMSGFTMHIKVSTSELSSTQPETNKKSKFELANKLYFIFMDHLCDSDTAEFVESDPDNLPSGTRNTEKGMKLFNEIESALEDL